MIWAISSGLSPSRSNLNVTIFLLWVSSWHSATLSPRLEIYTQRNTQRQAINRRFSLLGDSEQSVNMGLWCKTGFNVESGLSWISRMCYYIENVEFGLGELLVARSASYRTSLMPLGGATLVAASSCPSSSSLVAVTQAWCLRVATEVQMRWRRPI